MDDLDREIDELFKNNSKKIPQRTKKFLFAFVFALIFSFVADKFSFLFPANTIFRSIYYFILIVLIVFFAIEENDVMNTGVCVAFFFFC